MSEEKKYYMEPEVHVGKPNVPAMETKKQTWQRKHVIMIVAGVMVFMLVVLAGLCGYFITKANIDLAKMYTLHIKDENNNDMNETVRNDVEENTQLFHIHTKTNEQWILKDFNRDIDVYKVQEVGKTRCFVSPLNISREIAPRDMEPALTGGQLFAGGRKEMINYHTHGSPIPDTTFLGPEAMKLCKGEVTYWLYPECDDENDTTGTGVVRRSIVREQGDITVRVQRAERALFMACICCCYKCCNNQD